MNEAEARAHVTERLRLTQSCRFDGQILSGLDPCPCCGVRRPAGPLHNAIPRDWHVWEDLLPAMVQRGYYWEATRFTDRDGDAAEQWQFYRGVPPDSQATASPSPIIAAALALQQEAGNA